MISGGNDCTAINRVTVFCHPPQLGKQSFGFSMLMPVLVHRRDLKKALLEKNDTVEATNNSDNR